MAFSLFLFIYSVLSLVCTYIPDVYNFFTSAFVGCQSCCNQFFIFLAFLVSSVWKCVICSNRAKQNKTKQKKKRQQQQHELTLFWIQHHCHKMNNQLENYIENSNIENSCLRLHIKVFKFLLQVYRVLYSAQFPRLISDKTSFKNMLNNNGPTIDACGTPAVIFFSKDIVHFTALIGI